jgi:hypothetical protein
MQEAPMTVSELVAQLQNIRAQYGDVPVYVATRTRAPHDPALQLKRDFLAAVADDGTPIRETAVCIEPRRHRHD